MTSAFKQARIFKVLWEGSKAIVSFPEKPENKIN